MQRIAPFLWFDDAAEDAARFYTGLFPGARTGRIARYGKEGFEIHGQPEGRVMTVEFELAGFRFGAINGGPMFRFTPAISYLVTLGTEAMILRHELSALRTPLGGLCGSAGGGVERRSVGEAGRQLLGHFEEAVRDRGGFGGTALFRQRLDRLSHLGHGFLELAHVLGTHGGLHSGRRKVEGTHALDQRLSEGILVE